MTNSAEMLPFNISLLVLTPENLRGLRQIKVLDIFEGGGGKSFHPEGLFSTEIFGKVGDERRNRLFGYINLNTEIIHPVIFKALCDLKELYLGIMSGTSYAKFDPKLKDFVGCPITEGQTGFSFFLSHFNDLVFEERESTSREFATKLIYKYRNDALLKQLLVMPAGLRDYHIQDNGKPEEDEINSLYRRVLSNANIIGSHGKNNEHLDGTKYNLQKSVVDIHSYIVNLLEGKSKLLQGWWASRQIFYSTRNVITSNVPRTQKLFDETSIGPNNTVAGMYQCLQSMFPLTTNLVREYATKVFTGPNTPAYLVNQKTFERETVSVSPAHYDEWMTQEGFEQTLGRFETESLRSDPIVIEGRYFGLIYIDGVSVRFCQGIEELPEGYDKKYLSPITYAELFYLATFKRVAETPVFVTRYPITGLGSIYPSWIYMKSTTKSVKLKVLGPSWEDTGDVANEFPIRGVPFVNSMSPASQHLQRLTADFDGDTCSFTPVLTTEGIEEIRALLNSKEYYVGIDGKMNFSCKGDISNLVFLEMTDTLRD